MFVAEFKAWIASVEYKDGGKSWFDGPKDLFTYLADLKQYAPERKRAEIERVLVTDYYSTGALAAGEAFFVTGSDVMGPMGAELVPFKSKAEAESFLLDHKGKKVLTFDEVTPAVLDALK
jgi:nitrous oxide reductase accessory protein NosL